MTTSELARAYFEKCQARLKALAVLRQERSWSDVVREAQEIVELALKGMLRVIGIDPPRLNDVSQALLAQRARFPAGMDLDALARASVQLRKHREMAFYGAEDLIPTSAYDETEAAQAFDFAEQATDALARVLKELG